MDGQSNPISIAYDVTPTERREANYLLSAPRDAQGKPRGSPPTAGRSVIGWIIFLAVAAGLFALLRQQPHGTDPAPRPRSYPSMPVMIAMGVFGAGAACWIAAGVLMHVIRRRRERRPLHDVTMSFDEEGLTERTTGRTNVSFWARFTGLDEGRTVFVLRRTAREGIIIPKRLFADDAERERFRLLMQRHIARPAIPMALGFEVGRA
jgi:hypothetical protein